MANEVKPKKKKNILVRVLGILIVLILVAVVGVLAFIDQITRTAIETAGTTALGTPATLEKADVQILNGQVVLENMKIANPAGYQSPNLMEFAQVSSAVDIGSLTSDTVVVKHIVIDGLTLTIEQKGLSTNVQEVLDRLAEMAPKDQEPAPAEPKTGSGKKLAINRIEIRNTTTRVKLLEILSGDKDMVEAKLGTIVLEDISGDKNGAVLIADVIQKILIAVTQATIDGNPKDIPANLLNNLTTSVKLLEVSGGKAVKDAIEATGTIGKEALETTGEKLKEGAEGVKGAMDNLLKDPAKLLGGKKEPADKK